MVGKPKTRGEAAADWANQWYPEQGPEDIVWSMCYDGFMAGCEFIEQQLRETDGAYRSGYERAIDSCIKILEKDIDSRGKTMKSLDRCDPEWAITGLIRSVLWDRALEIEGHRRRSGGTP